MRGTGLEEFLPLLLVLPRERDGVDGVVKLGAVHTGPGVQLKEGSRHGHDDPSHLQNEDLPYQ